MSYIIWLVVGYFVGYACINFIRWLCSPDSTVQESKEESKATKIESAEEHSEDGDKMVVPTKECFAPRKPDPRYGYWIRPNVFKEYAEEDLFDIGLALSALSNTKSANIPIIKKLLLFDTLAHFFNFETQVDTGIAVSTGSIISFGLNFVNQKMMLMLQMLVCIVIALSKNVREIQDQIMKVHSQRITKSMVF